MNYSKSVKKIKKRLKLFVFIVLLTLIIARIFLTQKIAGIIGSGYEIQGVDVSHFQGS